MLKPPLSCVKPKGEIQIFHTILKPMEVPDHLALGWEKKTILQLENKHPWKFDEWIPNNFALEKKKNVLTTYGG